MKSPTDYSIDFFCRGSPTRHNLETRLGLPTNALPTCLCNCPNSLATRGSVSAISRKNRLEH